MDIYVGKGKTGHVQPQPPSHTLVIYVAPQNKHQKLGSI